MAIGYRALPPKIKHPKSAKIISNDVFNSFQNKNKLQVAPSLCKGHTNTEIWYVDDEQYRGYILVINTEDGTNFIAESICTFTPTMGMDKIDGSFAQDIEEYILANKYTIHSQRMDIFKDRYEVTIQEYLEARGFANLFNAVSENNKKWWQFWKKK